MTKRRNPESDIAEFFMRADPAAALSLYRVVRGILETRGVFKAEAANSAPARPRRPAPDQDAAAGE